MFRQGIPDIDVWVKEGTADVPGDGRFYVMRGDQRLASYKSKPAAIKRYQQLLREIGYAPPKRPAGDVTEILHREDIERDMERHEAFWSSSHLHKRRWGG